jgi:UPF0176 protein
METPITVTTFYRFAPIDQPAAHKPALHARMVALGIRGTLTLATEGVNATLSGEAEALNLFIAEMKHMLGIAHLPMARDSYTGEQPFKRSKVKVKRELISLGEKADPSVCVGEYVEPQAWNALITRTDVITIDTRNDYEFELGHFDGAINPGTRIFKQMVAFTRTHLDASSGKSIAMYCTGGIRCEKYSAYLVSLGFARVYHLKGGILAYLEQVPPEQSLWRGSCFVFDERVALGHGLTTANAGVAAS